jgi:hypothetical protein
MPEAVSPNTPSRRAVFAGAGALLAGAAISAVAASPAAGGPDAELIRLCGEFCALERQTLALSGNELENEDDNPFYTRQEEIAEYIADHPPQTLEGFRAVAYSAVLWAPDLFDNSSGELGGLHGTLNAALLQGLLGGVQP